MSSQILFEKGARPIKSKEIEAHYQSYRYQPVNLERYLETWRRWLLQSDNKTLGGLDAFRYGDYTHGTSQTFDQFILRHSASREIVVMRGEFQYHACVSKKLKFKIIDRPNQIENDQALIISAPFSDYGKQHPDFLDILHCCDYFKLPVCLDLAYWGISKNINIDLNRHSCIEEITASLSKPFFVLENHRVGVRFARRYLDDGISMINEVGMQNLHSMSVGLHFMDNFDNDWNWNTYKNAYYALCDKNGLAPTDTVIFATSALDRYQEFNRGIVGNHRICISKFLTDF